VKEEEEEEERRRRRIKASHNATVTEERTAKA